MQRGELKTRRGVFSLAFAALMTGLFLEMALKAQSGDASKPTAESGMHSIDSDLLFQAELQEHSKMPAVVAIAGREGKLVGSGDGNIRGSRIHGRVRWSNFEKVGEEFCQMNLAGYIETDDGARVDFDSTGYAVLVNPPKWNTAGTMRFTTKDKRYDWLNGKLSNWRGSFDSVSLHAVMQAFTIPFDQSGSAAQQ
jgi:hypothetical protein